MKFHVRFKTETEYRCMREIINLAIFDYSTLISIATNPYVARVLLKVPYDFFRVWRCYEGDFSVIRIDNDYLSLGSTFSIRVNGLI